MNQQFVEICEKYRLIAAQLDRIYTKVPYNQYNEQEHRVEIYLLSSFKAFCQHFQSIPLLLENNLTATVLLPVRTIYELYINLEYIFESDNPEEHYNRVCYLEGTELNQQVTNIKIIKSIKEGADEIARRLYKNYNTELMFSAIKNIKNTFPELIEDDSFKNIRISKRVPNIQNRFKLLYSDISSFCHNSPILKYYMLSQEDNPSSNEYFLKTVNQYLEYNLVFVRSIISQIVLSLLKYVDDNAKSILQTATDNISNLVHDYLNSKTTA